MISGKPGHHPTIIIIKKVNRHRLQHSGAWKVAYADFVTALMALFIVLWLLSSSEPVKQAVSDYFKDPSAHRKLLGSGMASTGESIQFSKRDLEKLKDKLESEIRKIPDLKALKNQVTMNVTAEGLRIELLESPEGCFFERGSAQPTPLGVEIITILGKQLGELPNNVLLEGHTDSTPYGVGTSYSNWELSTDRANAARRIMQLHGVRENQVKAVRGYADQRLRDIKDPTDPSNRRISVVVAYQPDDRKNMVLPPNPKAKVSVSTKQS